MAKQVVTRPWIVYLPNGRMSLSLTAPADGTPPGCRVGRLEYVGPTAVQLPEQPLSKKGFLSWAWGLSQQGFIMRYRKTRPDEPAVEEEGYSEDELARINVTARLDCLTKGGRPYALLVVVANAGADPIRHVTVELEWPDAAGQPARVGAIPVLAAGGSSPGGSFDTSLKAGEPQSFAVDPSNLPPAPPGGTPLPDGACVVVKSRGHEVARIAARAAALSPQPV
jgi:hypothetical protein